MSKQLKMIWIDMDNSPHVPFFHPIIEELQRRGYPLLLTARDAFQVTQLVRLHGIECHSIGRHYGKNSVMKIAGLLIRTVQLLPVVLREKPALAVSHGSRAQLLAAKLLGFPSMVIADYEHARHITHPDWGFVPEVIPDEVAGKLAKRVLKYPGIKEDVYVPGFRPDSGILQDLGVKPEEILVTVRPPAIEAHYHNPESEALFAAAMDLLGNAEGVRTVLLPRSDNQKDFIKQTYAAWLDSGKIMIPASAVAGLNLIWHSDLVISGGGTMNREAAALGVPVYSIFRGKMGAVDRYLSQEGRLIMLASVEDVRSKVVLAKRTPEAGADRGDRAALQSIVAGIVQALEAR